MKLVDLDISEFEEFIKIYDLENMFDVFVDKHGNEQFNLNKTLYIKVDPKRLPEYECKYEMHWPLISYNIYGTTRLAWLLQKLNNVKAKDMFKSKQPKDKIKYLPQNLTDSVVSNINDF